MNLNKELEKRPFWIKLLPYSVFTLATLALWSATFPGWRWFLVTVLNADKPDLVLDLVKQLVPCYTFFTFASLWAGVLYALGRTDLLALKAVKLCAS